jgi:hypothetical protein
MFSISPNMRTMEFLTDRERHKFNIVVLWARESGRFHGVDIKDQFGQFLDSPSSTGELATPAAGHDSRGARVRPGACEPASCYDMILATDDSVFATPEISSAVSPVALARFAALVITRCRCQDLTGRSIQPRRRRKWD